MFCLLVIFFVVSLISLFSLREVGKKEKIRRTIFSLAIKTKRVVYREATIHNPEGDLLPDQLDDNLLSIMKKINN